MEASEHTGREGRLRHCQEVEVGRWCGNVRGARQRGSRAASHHDVAGLQLARLPPLLWECAFTPSGGATEKAA